MRKLLVKGAQSQPLSRPPGESLGCLQGGSCRGDLTQLCPGRGACVGGSGNTQARARLLGGQSWGAAWRWLCQAVGGSRRVTREPGGLRGGSHCFCPGNGVWKRCDFSLLVPFGTFSEEILTVEWGVVLGGQRLPGLGGALECRGRHRQPAVPEEGLGPCDLLAFPPLGPVDFGAVAFWGNPLAPFLPPERAWCVLLPLLGCGVRG